MSIYDLKIFSWLKKEIIDEILTNSSTEEFSTWDIILKQWQFSNWKWYIIKSWEVEVSINWNFVAKLWEWEIFWEIALLNEDERTATVKALTDLETIVISQESLLEIVNSWNVSVNQDVMSRIEENLRNV
jgi:hypothetical protein